MLIREISFSGVKLSQDITIKPASKESSHLHLPSSSPKQAPCLKLNSRQLHYQYYHVFFPTLSCLSLSFYIFRILGSYLFLFIRQIIIIKVLSIKGSSRWRNFWIVVWAVAILLFWPMLLNKRWESRNSSAVVWHPQKQNSSPKRAL